MTQKADEEASLVTEKLRIRTGRIGSGAGKRIEPIVILFSFGKYLAGVSFMVQVRQRGILFKWFFSALTLVLWFGQAVFAKATPPPQGSTAPANFEVLAKSAAAARDAGRTDDALGDYKRALELRADWAEGWWYLGTLEYSKDQYA